WRNGCSATSASSSGTSSRWFPSASSASAQSSTRREPALLQPRDLHLGPRLKTQVAERMPPPERQRLLQVRRRLRRRRSRRRDDELLEAVGVDLAGSDDKLIAAAALHDPLEAEGLTQPRCVHLDALRSGPGRLAV